MGIPQGIGECAFFWKSSDKLGNIDLIIQRPEWKSMDAQILCLLKIGLSYKTLGRVFENLALICLSYASNFGCKGLDRIHWAVRKFFGNSCTVSILPACS